MNCDRRSWATGSRRRRKKGAELIETAYSIEEEAAGGGKEQSLTAIAESYLRGYARHPADRAVDLMPADARWTKATRRLYDKLTPAEQGIIDSYAEDNPAIDWRQRARILKRIAQKLIIEAGFESRHTMILLDPLKGGT